VQGRRSWRGCHESHVTSRLASGDRRRITHRSRNESASPSFGNPDLPPQEAVNAKNNPTSLADPGPQNPEIASQFPSHNRRRRWSPSTSTSTQRRSRDSPRTDRKLCRSDRMGCCHRIEVCAATASARTILNWHLGLVPKLRRTALTCRLSTAARWLRRQSFCCKEWNRRLTVQCLAGNESRRRLPREGEPKRGPPWYVRLSPDPSPVRFDDRMAD
jgi:hypothetical protein